MNFHTWSLYFLIGAFTHLGNSAPADTQVKDDVSTAAFTQLESSTPKETKIKDDKEDVSTADRIGLDFGISQAYGYGHHGGFSNSHSNTYGVQVGLQQNGHYQQLSNQAGGSSGSYSTGYDAPNTWSNGNSYLRPGYAGGHSGAGVYGGRGQAFANHHSQQYSVNLGNNLVLLSNFKTDDNSTNETNAHPSKNFESASKQPTLTFPN